MHHCPSRCAGAPTDSKLLRRSIVAAGAFTAPDSHKDTRKTHQFFKMELNGRLQASLRPAGIKARIGLAGVSPVWRVWSGAVGVFLLLCCCMAQNSPTLRGSHESLMHGTDRLLTSSSLSNVNISAGDLHTCAVTAGVVLCWGSGADGRLGYGNIVNIGDDEHPYSAGAVHLGSAATVRQVSCASKHTCVLLSSGSVMCWGNGERGRLGYGNTDKIGDDELPSVADTVDLGSNTTVTQIAAGNFHTCALLSNGSVQCWGDGDAGQLGYGSKDDVGDDESPSSKGVVDLGSGAIALQVSAGDLHVCALLSTGSVKCWGFAGNGRLGYGNSNHIGDDELPSSVGVVDLGATATATQVSAGNAHTCALLAGGEVMCWGFAANGRLGYGNTHNIGDDEVPSSVGAIDLGATATATQVSAGSDHTCALLAGGEVMCWGNGANGRLGYGNTHNIGDDEVPSSVGAIDLGANADVVQVEAGLAHTCVVLSTDDVICWGVGNLGIRGSGDTTTIGDAQTPASAAPVQLQAPPSPSPTPSASSSPSMTSASTSTPSPSGSASATITASPSPTASVSASATASLTVSPTATVSGTPSPSGSASATITASPSPSATGEAEIEPLVGSQSAGSGSSQHSDLSGGAIAGIVLLGVAILCVAVFAVLKHSRSRRKTESTEQAAAAADPGPAMTAYPPTP